jgi:hypothetical protein
MGPNYNLSFTLNQVNVLRSYEHLKLGNGPLKYLFWIGASHSWSGSQKFARNIYREKNVKLATESTSEVARGIGFPMRRIW